MAVPPKLDGDAFTPHRLSQRLGRVDERHVIGPSPGSDEASGLLQVSLGRVQAEAPQLSVPLIGMGLEWAGRIQHDERDSGGAEGAQETVGLARCGGQIAKEGRPVPWYSRPGRGRVDESGGGRRRHSGRNRRAPACGGVSDLFHPEELP